MNLTLAHGLYKAEGTHNDKPMFKRVGSGPQASVKWNATRKIWAVLVDNDGTCIFYETLTSFTCFRKTTRGGNGRPTREISE